VAHREAQLRALASTQHGVVSTEQAKELQVDGCAIRRLVRSGRWSRVGAHALALTGAPPTELHACAAAVHAFGTDAALSHDSAAAYWGLRRFRHLPVHVTVPHGRNPAAIGGVQIHQSRRLPSRHVVDIEGLRVTSPARTVFDLSGTLRPLWRVEATLDDAWAAQLVDHPTMAAMVSELSGRGQRNVAQLRELVEARRTLVRPAESALERRFHRIVAEGGLPAMEIQRDVVDHEGWWGRVDAMYSDACVIVEIDGERWHSALGDRRRDDQRRQQHVSMGFVVLRFSEHDIWHRPEAVVDQLRRARSTGLASPFAA
jgi:very-short-patch-repair endonuclease